MTIEIAERLIKLRKEKGLSQEQLAEKLGVSRQAVSKWERAAASPDTDNLICLAKLYGVSLDELLANDEDLEEIARKKKEEEKAKAEEDTSFKDENKKKTTKVDIGLSGIHVVDGEDGDEVHVSFKDGIHVKDAKENKEVIVNGKTIKAYWTSNKTVKIVEGVITASYVILATIAYLLLGFYVERGWELGWILYLLIPVIASVFEVIDHHKLQNFAYPVLITAIYVFIGMYLNLWHPLWILFLTIPVYYIIVEPIDKYLLKKRMEHPFIKVNKSADDVIDAELKDDEMMDDNK